MRQAAQCAGRVIRNKNDYGVVIFADKRYSRAKLRSKLPSWIAQFLTSDSVDLDISGALMHVRSFLLQMAQPTELKSAIDPQQDQVVEYFRS